MNYEQICKRLQNIKGELEIALKNEDGDNAADLLTEQAELEAAKQDIESQMEEQAIEDREEY